MSFATIGDVAHGDVEAAKKVLLPPQRHQTDLTQILAHGGRIVVVGGRPSNFSPKHLTDPRVVFWHSTDPRTKRVRELPANARAVLFTQFVDHATDHAIRRQAHARGVYTPPGILTTGDVRDQLTQMLSHPIQKPAPEPEPLPVIPPPSVQQPQPVVTPTDVPAEIPEPMHTAALRKPKAGEVRDFIMKHGNPNAIPLPEGKRLLALLNSMGISSTEDSIRQGMRMYFAKPVPQPREDAPPSTRKEASKATPMPDRITTMLASANAGLELLRETLAEIEGEVKRLQQQRATAKQALEEYLT